jgi:prepilin-type N-terminal cleavage/methylation domain-containing protein
MRFPKNLWRPGLHNFRHGFTLIELLIVVAISAMLATLVITYSGTGRNQVALATQTTVLSELLTRAKSLAVAAYQNPAVGAPHACAYGVAFDPTGNTYSLVAYVPGSNCSSAATVQALGVSGGTLQEYDSGVWQTRLANGVQFGKSGTLGNPAALVLFYPPDPATLVSTGACTPGDGGCTYQFPSPPQTGAIYLVTVDGSAAQTITIGIAGQISW